MDAKVFNDSVHGHMYVHPLLVVITDTPQFQRLRNIKQVGTCYFVYPTASHSRFEHSLGTAHVAGKLFESLKKKGFPEDVSDVRVWEKRKLCVEIAGLCHDLGHGPFSHTWEKFRRRIFIHDKWTHEEESVRILDEILEESISPTKKFNGVRLCLVRDAFEFYGLDDDDIQFIKIMILGQKHPKHYMFQIVNNKNNDIDVDKWDYLARDSAMLNLPIGFDFKRLLNYCCVLKNENEEEEICFREKECAVLVEMFLARGRLHDRAYQHTKVKIIEEMLIDALVFANDRLKLTETPITKLTDHIYQKILYENFGNDENMRKAKEILRRIENRNLYKCIAREAFEGEIPDFREVKAHLGQMIDLAPFIDDLMISLIKLDMTNSNKEKTLKNVLVYYKSEDQTIKCKRFDWARYQDTLKPNMETLKRHQVLVLYKGREEFPKSLKNDVRLSLQNILRDKIY